MEMFKGTEAYHANDQQAWRQWLADHHKEKKAIWLIIYHKESATPSVYYNEAVDEALCFGWIDSVPKKRDAESYYVYFSQRNPKSNWSRVNKEKIARLLKAKKIAPSGLAMIALAKESGTWDALNDVENLIVPDDLQAAFDQQPEAFINWQNFSPSSRRGILEWIFNAKKPETRQKRILETVRLAQENLKANQPKQKK